MSPIADSRGGGRRKAHVRDVLAALGGSPEELDRPNDGADQDASLGARLDAYTRLAKNRPAPPPPPPAAEAETTAVHEPEAVTADGADENVSLGARLDGYTRPAAAEEPAPIVEPVAVAATASAPVPAQVPVAPTAPSASPAKPAPARRQPRPARRRPRLGLGSAVRRAALAVVRAARAFARALMHVARVSWRFVGRTARGLAAGLVGARAALKRPEPPPEPDHVAIGVSERVREWSNHEDAVDLADEEVPARETDVAAFEAPPFERRPGRRWTPRLRWALLALLAGAVIAIVTHGSHGNRATQTTSQAPEQAPSRSAYPDPRSYAAAMTRLALSSGRTELDGEPVCDQGSTYDHWTCRAQGRPTLGAYAGRLLTFRCSPRSTPQPGGAPAVLTDCRPENPPAA